MWVRDLVDADATVGGKAHHLGRMLAAGLAVPPGFVIAADAPLAVRAEVETRVAAIIARGPAPQLLAVRSSGQVEDTATGSAAGVLSSRTGVAPADVWSAIEEVRASAHTEAARRYAALRGGSPEGDSGGIAVIVQRFIEGTRVTVYTRAPNAPAGEALWIQTTGADGVATLREAAISDEHRYARTALTAERAIGATTGADVELVDDGMTVWIVQARPIVHAAPRPHAHPPPIVLAPLIADGRRWTWDIAHNPDPLSPAQAGLVEQVERAGIAPWALRVCGGYLYSTPAEVAAPVVAPVQDRDELERRAADIESRIAAILGSPRDLADAIQRYLAFYRVWATELVPLIAAARAGLTPDELAGARPSAVEATLFAAARGELTETEAIAQLGVLAPAWDVAVPTYGEDHRLLHDSIARARLVLAENRETARKPTMASGQPTLAQAAADLAERDDLWFARAQWLVRQALRKHATVMGIDPDDAAWLPLAELTPGHELDPDHARRRAAAARAAAARGAAWDMPIVVGGTAGASTELADLTAGSRTYRGIATGTGRIRGRVVRFDSLASAIAVGPRDVIVTRAVTPALAVIITGCGGLVSESGGPLDHGAAIARELQIPCVVGCIGAWRGLGDETYVTVDGSAGLVTIDNYSSSSS